MIKIKPQNPKGVRDFLPHENAQREYIINNIKYLFEIYGYDSIYTPVFERIETLMGKYGDEGEKLLFKILNSGNFFNEEGMDNLLLEKEKNLQSISNKISSKGLRYDHTVPLARYVAQYQNELTFPFKRYVIGPVWRADRPQKGRYQEFFQCDIDVVGSKSLLYEVEIVKLIEKLFEIFGINIEIKINNKKIFIGICQYFGVENYTNVIATIIDKSDKIGENKVIEELNSIINDNQKVNRILEHIQCNDYNLIPNFNKNILEGKEEIAFIFDNAKSTKLKYRGDLVRGLDYYTGAVLEVITSDLVFPSLAGGGRYDNLTEVFGLKDMSGIGFSLGLDRIYDVMKELNKFPKNKKNKKVIILYMQSDFLEQYINILNSLRENGIVTELYPSKAKIEKQLSYADKKNIDFALILGQEEFDKNTIIIKNLVNRTQKELLIDDLLLHPKETILHP